MSDKLSNLNDLDSQTERNAFRTMNLHFYNEILEENKKLLEIKNAILAISFPCYPLGCLDRGKYMLEVICEKCKTKTYNGVCQDCFDNWEKLQTYKCKTCGLIYAKKLLLNSLD